jgi:hypothetical protein
MQVRSQIRPVPAVGVTAKRRSGRNVLVQRAKSGDLHVSQHATWGMSDQMFKKTIAAALIATTTIASADSAANGIEFNQPSSESSAVDVAIGAGVGVGLSIGATAAALSAAGIAAVPHAAGGMILISTATGSSYIAGTLGVIGGAAACVASVLCAVAVAGGAAIVVGGGYYAYEAINSKKIEYDGVIKEDKKTYYSGDLYFRIVDKFVTPEKRNELNDIAENDQFRQPYYSRDGVMLHWGLVNDHYYVRSDIAEKIKSQFNSGGLYEVDARDK